MTPTIDTAALDSIVLSQGRHATREADLDFLEAVALMAGEEHTDRPRCMCPVLIGLCGTWNDHTGDEDRQRLKPYIPRVIGTNDGHAAARRALCLDYLVRGAFPALLAHVGLLQPALNLTSMQEITNSVVSLAGAVGAIQFVQRRLDFIVGALEHPRHPVPPLLYAVADGAWGRADGEAPTILWHTAQTKAWQAVKTAARLADPQNPGRAEFDFRLERAMFDLLEKLLAVGRA